MDSYDPDRNVEPEDDTSRGEPVPLDLAFDLRSVRVPHHLAYLRRRPRRQPRWSPQRDGGHHSRQRQARSLNEGWHKPRLRAAPDGGQARINFSYRNHGTTSAAFGVKSGRNQYFEGPYEAAFFRQLETDADVIDYQFQPLTIEWETRTGDVRSYTCDGIYETAKGLTAFENKANWAYFNDPQTDDTLEQAQLEFAKHGLDFERVEGTQLLDPVRLDMVKEVFDLRLISFGLREINIAIEVLSREGGTAPLGAIWERLSPNRGLAQAQTCAMLVRREIGFSLVEGLTADAHVHRPQAPTNRRRLRPFLTLHSGE